MNNPKPEIVPRTPQERVAVLQYAAILHGINKIQPESPEVWEPRSPYRGQVPVFNLPNN
jgi:hypothetical protein